MPCWVGPVAIVLAGSDALSGVVDPALPLIGAAAIAAVAGNAVVFD